MKSQLFYGVDCQSMPGYTVYIYEAVSNSPPNDKSPACDLKKSNIKSILVGVVGI